MSEGKEISIKVEDICEENYPAIYGTNSLDQFINKTKEDLKGLVFDLSTAKGRKECASQAAKVSSSKKAVENAGRAYLKIIKAKPKVIEKELREFVESMDKLRDETRKPLTDWEAEQAKIEAERIAAEEAEKLRVQIENDHEVAILLNEKYDRDLAEAEAEKERQRIAYEAEIARLAKERAIKEERQRQADAEKERVAAEQEKARQAAEAERQRIEEQVRKDAEHKAAIERAEAEKAEAERKAAQAIEDERQRVAAEVEQKRLDDEKRERDKRHVGAVRKAAKEAFIAEGLTEEQAKTIVLAINAGKIPNVSIKY
jgi:colicin import membrane protein